MHMLIVVRAENNTNDALTLALLLPITRISRILTNDHILVDARIPLSQERSGTNDVVGFFAHPLMRSLTFRPLPRILLMVLAHDLTKITSQIVIIHIHHALLTELRSKIPELLRITIWILKYPRWRLMLILPINRDAHHALRRPRRQLAPNVTRAIHLPLVKHRRHKLALLVRSQVCPRITKLACLSHRCTMQPALTLPIPVAC